MSLNGLGKSRKYYDKIINEIDKKDHLDELYNKGVDFLNEEEYRKALGMFKKVISLNPNDAEVWSYIGEILGRFLIPCCFESFYRAAISPNIPNFV